MKPLWSEAPVWAEYLAMDHSGGWWWFAKKPQYMPRLGIWENQPGTKAEIASVCDKMQASMTMEPRP